MTHRRTALLLLLCVGCAGAAVGAAVGAFTATTANPTSSFQAKLVFAGQRSTTAWDIRDASSGTESNQTNVFAAANDGRTRTTTSWSLNYASNRYLEFDLNAPLPAAITVSGISLNLRVAASLPLETACYYFEVRRASTGAVVRTFGSSSSDVACATGTTLVTTSTDITTAVGGSDVANDLRIRVYGKDSLLGAMRLDLLTVSGSTAFGTFALYPRLDIDAADTTLATTIWSVAAAGDGTSFQSASTWSSSFNSSRYVSYSFPAYVPNAAVVTGASIEHTYRSSSGSTCYYFEVYSGAALVETFGSPGSPVDCNAMGAFETITTDLGSVDTPGELNNLTMRVYYSSSTGAASQTDAVKLNVTYYVDP